MNNNAKEKKQTKTTKAILLMNDLMYYIEQYELTKQIHTRVNMYILEI